MEQHYDGLKGKVVQWTFENGNENHDPSILAFVVGPDGKVFASLVNGQQYQPGAFVKWAKQQVDAYAKAHPSTRLPFIRTDVVVSGDGEDAEAVCAELDKAREDAKPVMLYFGRGHYDAKDKRDRTGKKETKAARKFEKGVLNSKSAAKEAEGWVLLRFDLADAEHAAFAERLGVTSAPALLVFSPGAEEPVVLDPRITGAALALQFKKRKAPDSE